MNKLLMAVLVLGLSACATYEQQRAATTGAVVGGAVGAAIGANSGRVAEGAAVGAAVGAATGAIIMAPRGGAYKGEHNHGNGYWRHHHGDGNYTHRHNRRNYRGNVYYQRGNYGRYGGARDGYNRGYDKHGRYKDSYENKHSGEKYKRYEERSEDD